MGPIAQLDRATAFKSRSLCEKTRTHKVDSTISVKASILRIMLIPRKLSVSVSQKLRHFERIEKPSLW